MEAGGLGQAALKGDPRSMAGTLTLLGFTLCAFAANSLLCRAGLADGAADPLSFTAVRLCAGAIVLVGLQRGVARCRFDIGAAVALYVYATCFSLAYVALDAGTGALLLFGAVQMTMLGAALWRGERPSALAWIGFVCAVLGLLWLLFPDVDRPSPFAALEMLVAGAAWGVYSLRGQRHVATGDAQATTAGNFLVAMPFALLALMFEPTALELAPRGFLAAVLSGAAASGLAYVLWYALLPRLPAIVAASAQLAVPLLTAIGGVVFLAESPGPRLVVSAGLVIGGICLVILAGHLSRPD